VKSALFVDFDNVYSGLRKLDQVAADRFALRPTEWMNWIVSSLELPDHARDDARRRVLVRRCYLNPQAYQRFRPSFNLAGFEIIDCPALTSEGKTSTDIHMVLDIVDLLQHEAHYDEFIVFSADADFTPVLRKLRRWDRRTTVLAIGFPSAAYRASADLLIDQDDFIEEALGVRNEEDSVPEQATIQATTGEVVTTTVTLLDEADNNPLSSNASIGDLRRLAELIKTEVNGSNRPVAASRLAELIKSHPHALAAGWNGKGTFRKFVESLDLTPVEFAWNRSGGCAYDPNRHTLPHGQDATVSADDWGAYKELFSVAKQVHEVTDAPLWPPDTYRAVLEAVVMDVTTLRFELTETSKRVRDRCRDSGHLVSRGDITFILRGLLFRGHIFGTGKDSVPSLSRKLADNIRSLCLREQMVIDSTTDSVITKWIASGE
jgi:hypothetical protein